MSESTPGLFAACAHSMTQEWRSQESEVSLILFILIQPHAVVIIVVSMSPVSWVGGHHRQRTKHMTADDKKQQ